MYCLNRFLEETFFGGETRDICVPIDLNMLPTPGIYKIKYFLIISSTNRLKVVYKLYIMQWVPLEIEHVIVLKKDIRCKLDYTS